MRVRVTAIDRHSPFPTVAGLAGCGQDLPLILEVLFEPLQL